MHLKFRECLVSLIVVFLSSFAFSQGPDLSDLGKATLVEVKRSMPYPVHEQTGAMGSEVITYKSTDGSYIGYTFQDYRLANITFMTAFATTGQAEKALEKKYDELVSVGLSPHHNGRMTLFMDPNHPYVFSLAVDKFEGIPYFMLGHMLAQ